jgi:transposase InsO family protein
VAGFAGPPHPDQAAGRPADLVAGDFSASRPNRLRVDWFNHRRLLEPIGHVPPAEFEATYRHSEDPSRTTELKDPSLR